MVVVLLSWLYIGFVSLTLGLSFHLMWEQRPALHRKKASPGGPGPSAGSPQAVRGERPSAETSPSPGGRTALPSWASPEVWLLTGLALAAVYAQVFSLFGGVGMAANTLLAGICLILSFLHRRNFPALLSGLRGRCPALRIALCAAIVLGMAALTAQTPAHYDTYLYHAQAIHWIEEYGCVIGLGNLHNRFAYNSSFLVLQALFSLSFAADRSLHTLNGFVAALFASYSLCSLKALRRRGLFVSDALRAGLVYYLLHNSTYLSSPNTDTFALSLAFYVFLKWCDCLEEQEEHTRPWAWLCLMTVFACTLKLSSAFLLILLLKPLRRIFREKDGRTLIFCAACTAGIALPYFIRNILLSGYVLYPYSFLDIIPFADWKMDAGVLDYDRLEIMAWGRCVYDVTLLDRPLSQWLPAWFAQQTSVGKREILAAAVSAAGLAAGDVFLLVRGAAQKLRRTAAAPPQSPQGSGDIDARAQERAAGSPQHGENNDAPSRNSAAGSPMRPEGAPSAEDRFLISFAALFCLAGWLFTAPLLRYGEVYLLIAAGLFVPGAVRRLWRLLPHRGRTALSFGQVWGIAALCLVLLRGGMMLRAYYPNGLSLSYQDYAVYECTAVEWNGVTIYVTADGTTQAGYDPFPAIFSEETLSGIRLRGETLRDGFLPED